MTAWFRRSESHAAIGIFGPLEQRVLDALWTRNAEASVRDLQPEFTDIAYTTLMTTLDRLHRKGVLDRTKRGKAFFYVPRLTRSQFESARAATAFRRALDQAGGTALRPLLSFLVEAVGERDRELLDELEALVRARRKEFEHRQS